MEDNVSQVEDFMRAIIGQESGGDYSSINSDSGAYGAFQIMPENWENWLGEAGLPITSPKTAENQTIVARAKMIALFNLYGNWRDVAIAWYHGTNGWELKNRSLMDTPFNRAGNFDSNGEYPSLNSYGDSVYSSFKKITGNTTQDFNENLQPEDKGFWGNLVNRINSPLSFEKTIPQAQENNQTIITQTKDFVTKGVKTIGFTFVGLVLMILGIYLLNKNDTLVLQKDGE